MKIFLLLLAFCLMSVWGLLGSGTTEDREAEQILNVSYDSTRELYEQLNQLFAQREAAAGRRIRVEQSHAGSSKQVRAVRDGLQADVVTLALGSDITTLEQVGLIHSGWDKRPYNASPYASTIVLLVRRGNPKHIADWGDLVRPGVSVITANPKTSGAARWAFLSAWAFGAGLCPQVMYQPNMPAATRPGDGEGSALESPSCLLESESARQFVRALYANVPVLDTGARGSVVTFAQKKIGDTLIAWESDAWLARQEFAEAGFEIVYPSATMLAEPPVAIVDSVVDARGTRAAAEAYLQFLYTPEAQNLIGSLHYRPRDPDAAARYATDLPTIPVWTIAEFGGWSVVQSRFFGEAGEFDRIYQRK